MGFGLSYAALQHFFSPREPKFRIGDDGWHLNKASINPTKVATGAATAARNATAAFDYRLLFKQICPASASSLPSVFATATDVRRIIGIMSAQSSMYMFFCV